MRSFASISICEIPDESTILNSRRRIEDNELTPVILERVNTHLKRQSLLLQHGTMVDATIIHAPSSTKNEIQERDPEMSQTKKGNQWYFGMKAHIGADTDSGLVHTVLTTAANEADIEVADELLHGKEQTIHADAALHRSQQALCQKEAQVVHSCQAEQDPIICPKAGSKIRLSKTSRTRSVSGQKSSMPLARSNAYLATARPASRD
jgi:transposase, IS5 family